MKDALAGLCPDVGHHRDDVQTVRDTVVGVPDVGFRGDGADVSVLTLESAFPVVIPGFVAIDVAREQGVSGHHDSVVDGLGAGGHGERHEAEKQRDFVDQSAA
jgi:hypothetical protein